VPPNLSLLQAPNEGTDSTDSGGSDANKSGGVPMRRSMSDTDQNEELVKVIASKQKNLHSPAAKSFGLQTMNRHN